MRRITWKTAGVLAAAAIMLAGCGNGSAQKDNVAQESTEVQENDQTEEGTDMDTTTQGAIGDNEEGAATSNTESTDETVDGTGADSGATATATGMEKQWQVSEHPFLKADGKVLRDNEGKGDVVQLKGTNVGGYLFQEFWMTVTDVSGSIGDESRLYAGLEDLYGVEGREELINLYQDNYITEADFDYFQEVGMNCIRLPFWYRNLVDETGAIKDNWYERFDWFVQEASKRGIYVILDFHGAPGSQNGSDHSGVDGGGNKMAASQFFFGGNAAANQELYYQLWETIAEHYKGNEWVAGYDLLNEPFCTYRYNTPISDDELHEHLWAIYDVAYDRIRAIDPDHLIIMEATWDPVDLPDPAKYEWENVMYEYHNYLYDDYNNDRGEQIKNMKKKLDAIETAGYNVPSYMGEFAYFNNLDAWDEGIALLTDSGISWTTWTYKVTESNGNWGIQNQKDPHVKVDMLSREELEEKWSAVGEAKENTGLRNVLEKYYKQAYVSAE